jgi:dienelactone hydrolase
MALLDFRERLLTCLGGPWPESPPLNVQILGREQVGDVTRIKLTYDAEPNDPIPAYLLLPPGAADGRRHPAVAVWHQHNGAWHLGKVEPAGVAGSEMHHTGLHLAQAGYVVLCPDALCFGERQHPELAGGNFERFEFLRYVVSGRCMAWKNILDMRRAIDFLVSRPEVDEERIGCYGHSMGSTHTWLVGPWEPRIKCLVGNCCLPTYAAIHRTHILHCFPNFIPGLFQYGDTPDIAALIAPRPLMLNWGDQDGGSPIEEVRAAIPIIQQAYDSVHASDNFSPLIQEQTGHVLSPEMWQRTLNWFNTHLRG